MLENERVERIQSGLDSLARGLTISKMKTPPRYALIRWFVPRGHFLQRPSTEVGLLPISDFRFFSQVLFLFEHVIWLFFPLFKETRKARR